MAKEIERKFIIDKNIWQPTGKTLPIRQGYLSTDPERTIRVRIAGEDAFLTIKSKGTGISRDEYEYKIPYSDAGNLLQLVAYPPIVKTRYKIVFEGKLWDVDVFSGENEGLILAEVELDSEDEVITLPKWVKYEVTNDARFFNSYLTAHPYKRWEENS
ncbi:hypothetical protein MNBD_BACTEROID01-2947 [hydrothermal vent metagenome]|uniref:CYTH domain-containing protein n=1 Tax=hydrothermal vent metagenome TaxID=652676 RepID=A0A3B0U5I3_9ZZZZ